MKGQIKKTIAILLVVLFLVTITVSAVSATEIDSNAHFSKLNLYKMSIITASYDKSKPTASIAKEAKPVNI
jgi:ABC-type phosphate/phosphonate transport system permease subunit